MATNINLNEIVNSVVEYEVENGNLNNIIPTMEKFNELLNKVNFISLLVDNDNEASFVKCFYSDKDEINAKEKETLSLMLDTLPSLSASLDNELLSTLDIDSIYNKTLLLLSNANNEMSERNIGFKRENEPKFPGDIDYGPLEQASNIALERDYFFDFDYDFPTSDDDFKNMFGSFSNFYEDSDNLNFGNHDIKKSYYVININFPEYAKVTTNGYVNRNDLESTFQGMARKHPETAILSSNPAPEDLRKRIINNESIFLENSLKICRSELAEINYEPDYCDKCPIIYENTIKLIDNIVKPICDLFKKRAEYKWLLYKWMDAYDIVQRQEIISMLNSAADALHEINIALAYSVMKFLIILYEYRDQIIDIILKHNLHLHRGAEVTYTVLNLDIIRGDGTPMFDTFNSISSQSTQLNSDISYDTMSDVIIQNNITSLYNAFLTPTNLSALYKDIFDDIILDDVVDHWVNHEIPLMWFGIKHISYNNLESFVTYSKLLSNYLGKCTSAKELAESLKRMDITTQISSYKANSYNEDAVSCDCWISCTNISADIKAPIRLTHYNPQLETEVYFDFHVNDLDTEYDQHRTYDNLLSIDVSNRTAGYDSDIESFYVKSTITLNDTDFDDSNIDEIIESYNLQNIISTEIHHDDHKIFAVGPRNNLHQNFYNAKIPPKTFNISIGYTNFTADNKFAINDINYIAQDADQVIRNGFKFKVYESLSVYLSIDENCSKDSEWYGNEDQAPLSVNLCHCHDKNIKLINEENIEEDLPDGFKLDNGLIKYKTITIISYYCCRKEEDGCLGENEHKNNGKWINVYLGDRERIENHKICPYHERTSISVPDGYTYDRDLDAYVKYETCRCIDDQDMIEAGFKGHGEPIPVVTRVYGYSGSTGGSNVPNFNGDEIGYTNVFKFKGQKFELSDIPAEIFNLKHFNTCWTKESDSDDIVTHLSGWSCEIPFELSSNKAHRVSAVYSYEFPIDIVLPNEIYGNSTPIPKSRFKNSSIYPEISSSIVSAYRIGSFVVPSISALSDINDFGKEVSSAISDIIESWRENYYSKTISDNSQSCTWFIGDFSNVHASSDTFAEDIEKATDITDIENFDVELSSHSSYRMALVPKYSKFFSLNIGLDVDFNQDILVGDLFGFGSPFFLYAKEGTTLRDAIVYSPDGITGSESFNFFKLVDLFSDYESYPFWLYATQTNNQISTTVFHACYGRISDPRLDELSTDSNANYILESEEVTGGTTNLFTILKDNSEESIEQEDFENATYVRTVFSLIGIGNYANSSFLENPNNEFVSTVGNIDIENAIPQGYEIDKVIDSNFNDFDSDFDIGGFGDPITNLYFVLVRTNS